MTRLHYAAHEGNAEEIAKLIKAGADIDARDEGGKTPIWWTVHAGDRESYWLLRKAEPWFFTSCRNNRGETLLHVVLTKAAMSDDAQGSHRNLHGSVRMVCGRFPERNEPGMARRNRA